jgi:ATP-dependent Clp protease ATP-binding subunit ClpC
VGYEEGGQLTEAVRRRPYQVVLFDEIEKAHPDVWNSLLQILEDGRLTDGQGRTVDFRNTVLIMTSNLGTEFARKGGALGFMRPGEGPSSAEVAADHKKIEDALKRAFRPEFLNRVDEIIVFNTLSLEAVEQIVGLQMRSRRTVDRARLDRGIDRGRAQMAGEAGLRPAVRREAAAPCDSKARRKPALRQALARRVPFRRLRHRGYRPR